MSFLSRLISPKGKELFAFLLVAIALYSLWHFGYEEYLSPNTKFDHRTSHFIAEQAAAIIGWFGHETAVVNWSIYPNLIVVDGKASVSVATQCNGLPMLFLFAGFLLAYPGPWRRKVWFIPAGILFIHLLNLARIIALSYLINTQSPLAFELNHKYIFQIVVYTVMGLLWVLWIAYLSNSEITVRSAFSKWIRLNFIWTLFTDGSSTPTPTETASTPA